MIFLVSSLGWMFIAIISLAAAQKLFFYASIQAKVRRQLSKKDSGLAIGQGMGGDQSGAVYSSRSVDIDIF